MATGYQAVILAAGRGSRLGSTTEEYPKALLPIGPRSAADATETSFLRRQAELLLQAGVEQVVVVVGYHRDQIVDAAASWNLPLEFAVNPTPEIMDSGSLHSFQFASRAGLGVLDGTRQTLLLDADIAYEPRLLETFLAAPARTSLLVHGRTADNDEEVRVFGTASTPRFLGKGLRGALVAGLPCIGEAVGIVKFAPEDHALARETMDWMLGDPSAPEGSGRWKGYGPAKRRTEHEELSQRFMHYGKISAVMVDRDVLFMEVDDAKEYAQLRENLYPRILEKEAAR